MTVKPQASMRNVALGLIAAASLALAACGGQSSAAAPHPTATATIPAKWRGIVQTPLPEPTPPYSFPVSWQSTQSLPARVSSFAFAPSAPLIGYACTQAPADADGTPGAVACYRTADGGQSWSPIASAPFQRIHFWSITVDQSDPRDFFIAGLVPWSPNPAQGTYALWRSRDAGGSWAMLGQPDTGSPLALEGIAVVGARIVVSVNVDGEGQLPNNLFASDDEGASWKPFGINLGGQGVNAMGLEAMGTTLLVAAQMVGAPAAMAFRVPLAPERQDAPASACGPTGTPTPTPAKPASWRPGIACGNSSGTPVPITYWRTADGGRTWTQVHVPGNLPIFTLAATGSSYYGISLAFADGRPTVVYWTRDAGATWTALPTLQGVEGGYVDATNIGTNGETAVAPDGTIYVGTWHLPAGSDQGGPAGVFTIRPTDPASQWRPLASEFPTPPQGWQATPGPHGLRLWGVAGTLMYVDMP